MTSLYRHFPACLPVCVCVCVTRAAEWRKWDVLQWTVFSEARPGPPGCYLVRTPEHEKTCKRCLMIFGGNYCWSDPMATAKNQRAYGRPGYQRQTFTLAIALAWPLTAVEVSLSSLASCSPRSCYIASFFSLLVAYWLPHSHLHYKLESPDTTCGKVYWSYVVMAFVHCQTSFTCLLPATSPLWNWAVRRSLEFIKLSGAGRLQEAQIGLPFSVLSTDLW